MKVIIFETLNYQQTMSYQNEYEGCQYVNELINFTIDLICLFRFS